jgi:hypothetical protein
LVLSLETLGAHGRKKALDFHLVGCGSVFLEDSSVSSKQVDGGRGTYLGSVSVGEVKIGFVTGLETEDPVTENFLALPNDIQPPVGSVIEWDTFGFGFGFKRHRDQEHQMWDSPRNQSTLTRVLMLAIMYRISGVNTKGGVCVYRNDQRGEKRAMVPTILGCRRCSCLSREHCHLRWMEPRWRFPESYHQRGR